MMLLRLKDLYLILILVNKAINTSLQTTLVTNDTMISKQVIGKGNKGSGRDQI
jgi:hypothetical protein